MNIKTPKGEGEFGWLVLGGCCGSLAYVVFFAWEGARVITEDGAPSAAWEVMMLPISFLFGVLVIGLLLEELASRRWLPRQWVIWLLFLVCTVLLFVYSQVFCGGTNFREAVKWSIDFRRRHVYTDELAESWAKGARSVAIDGLRSPSLQEGDNRNTMSAQQWCVMSRGTAATSYTARQSISSVAFKW